jgi:hypothetical protein
LDKSEIPPWLTELADVDFQLIKRFILCSGSLKDLAAEYGISYPTMRLRLDRLIEKVRILDGDRPITPFRRRLQLLVAEGTLDHRVARTILREHERAMKEDHTND